MTDRQHLALAESVAAGAPSPFGSRPGAGIGKSFLIAVLDCEDIGEPALLHRLRELGHCPVSFPWLERYVSASENGVRFDLLVTTPRPSQRWCEVLAACRALAVPIIVLAHTLQLSVFGDALAGSEDCDWTRVNVNLAVLPISDLELACRIDLSVRSHAGTMAIGRSSTLKFGAYRFDTSRRRATLHDVDQDLSPREFQVALLLFENVGHVVQRDFMQRLLWGAQKTPNRSRALDMYVSKLRKKLQLSEANGFELFSVYKRGYELLKVRQEPARTQRSIKPQTLRDNLPDIFSVEEIS